MNEIHFSLHFPRVKRNKMQKKKKKNEIKVKHVTGIAQSYIFNMLQEVFIRDAYSIALFKLDIIR